MSDLVRRLKNEFTSWYTPRENRDVTETPSDDVTLLIGLLEIPHPTLKIKLTLNQHIKNENLADLIDKPLSDVATDEFLGSFTGVDDSTVDPDQFYITHARGDNSGRNYEFVLGDLDDYRDFKNTDEIIEFIRNLPRYPLTKLTAEFDAFNESGIEVSKNKNEIVFRVREYEGDTLLNVTIDAALLDRIVEAESTAQVDKIFTELVVGEDLSYNDNITDYVLIVTLTDLYAKRTKAFDAARPALVAMRNDSIKREMADSLDIASLVTFSDCLYNHWKALPETTFRIFDTSFKLPSELTEDEAFLESVAKYAQRRDGSKSLLEESFMFTPCARLQASTGTYFAKQVLLPKVPSVDYELQTAQRLRDAGFDVPKPVGLAVIRKAPHIVFEYAENSVNLMGQDSSYKLHEELAQHLKKQRKQVYTALGQYVRRMFDADIVDMDMATRNFMVKFDSEGNFQRVFQVDFEKTVFLEDDPTLRNVTKRKTKERALQAMRSNMTRAENKYFNAGYKN